MALLDSSLYRSMCIEVKTFLPSVDDARLASCNLDELAALVAEARVAARHWEYTIARGVARGVVHALGGK